MKAVIVLSHGSKSTAAQAEVAELARRIAREGGFAYVQPAYLDSAEPLFADAVTQLAGRGAADITVVLHFLNSGNHVTRDVPELVRAASEKHPGISFKVTRPLGLHPVIPALCFDLIREAQQAGDSHA